MGNVKKLAARCVLFMGIAALLLPVLWGALMAAVLNAAFASPGISLLEIAERVRLTRQSVSKIVAELSAFGVLAFDEDGRARAGMGVDMSDYDNDGRLDAVVTNFQGEPNALYRNLGQGLFVETTWAAGLGEATLPYLGWGTRFADLDNDGWPDLLFVNGHVYPEVDRHRLDETYAQRALVFRGLGGARFANVSSSAGPDLARPRAGRGAAFGDYDEDGRLDVLVSAVNDKVALLRNESPTAHHWLAVRLEGRKSNRQGLGARIVLEAGGRRQVREVHAGGSYLSQSDPRAHFGLGGTTSVEAVLVQWPSGRQESWPVPGVDRLLALRQGTGKPWPGQGP